ncbi:MAG TPA: T9SS type A sorting domain-containing protein, partial [Chitinophagaceae bacterium]|nr:T9SS type A sorting domain-containing protein [Chitinophagaceae bacterium]
NIVFENVNSSRDVSLMDVSGKTLKQWKGVTNNNIQIDNLNAGFYSVRIVNNETGEHTVEKFIVNKR